MSLHAMLTSFHFEDQAAAHIIGQPDYDLTSPPGPG
jgi:hypothetical protein